jgi:hypothetical protein
LTVWNGRLVVFTLNAYLLLFTLGALIFFVCSTSLLAISSFSLSFNGKEEDGKGSMNVVDSRSINRELATYHFYYSHSLTLKWRKEQTNKKKKFLIYISLFTNSEQTVFTSSSSLRSREPATAGGGRRTGKTVKDNNKKKFYCPFQDTKNDKNGRSNCDGSLKYIGFLIFFTHLAVH